MAPSSRFIQIGSALVLAAVMVIGAYLAARNTANPSLASATSEGELLNAIASRDSDGDGLPDWEEALYGTDPSKVDTRALGMSDGEAVKKGLIVPKAISEVTHPKTGEKESASTLGLPSPSDGSLTDVFARNFFTLYLATKQQSGGTDMTPDEITALAEKSLVQLSNSIQIGSDFKSASDIIVSGSGETALRAYAASADIIAGSHSSKLPKSELKYLEEMLAGDSSASQNIKKITTAYRDIASGLAALHVPQEVASAHLKLVNSLARISVISSDFVRLDTDPLSTMFALEQYKPAVIQLSQAFTDIQTVFKNAGVSIPAGTPGSGILHVGTSPTPGSTSP